VSGGGSSSMRHTLRCLYVCYLSLDDPLVHSQVVAYLEGLAARGHTVHLLTFDTPLSPTRREELRRDLEERGITWHSRRYHKRPSLPATLYDATAGALAALRIMRRYRLDTVHARNHVPAAMALIVKRVSGSRMIFDLRGLMAEEYVDAGRWKAGGVPYRLTRRVQHAAINRADGMVMLTNAVRRHLFDGSQGGAPRTVIPCCADVASLNGDIPTTEADVRVELGARERPIMIYVGKFTGWYLEAEMVDFFAAARMVEPNLLFLVLSQSNPEIIERDFARAGIPPADFRVTRSEPGEVGRYLGVADFGISFVRPCFSKISSSPTKVGEYLAAGLPVVSTAGIGDVDELLGSNRVGVLIRDLDPSAYESAARQVIELAADPAARQRCRSVARAELSLTEVGIPRYDRLYREVAARR
jgi:glycosyltransferase involved in cell wall biosynthesis